MPLTMAETGVENQIKKIGGKSDVRLFLEKLGFVVGSIVTVILKTMAILSLILRILVLL